MALLQTSRARPSSWAAFTDVEVFPNLDVMAVGLALLFVSLSAAAFVQLYLRGWRWRSLAGLLLLAGLLREDACTTSTGAAVSYAQGTAVLMRLPDLNPDPAMRFPVASLAGCCVGSQAWSTWNNRTVLLLHALFGRMPGVYDGPYPSGEEARLLLSEHGQTPVVDGGIPQPGWANTASVAEAARVRGSRTEDPKRAIPLTRMLRPREPPPR